MSQPAGTIRFTFCEEQAEAVLGRDGVWTCTIESLVGFLNSAFDPKWYGESPADGSPLLAALHDAHKHFGGELQVTPSNEPPGTVY